jgi:hypothetical protein
MMIMALLLPPLDVEDLSLMLSSEKSLKMAQTTALYVVLAIALIQ